MTCIAKII